MCKPSRINVEELRSTICAEIGFANRQNTGKIYLSLFAVPQGIKGAEVLTSALFFFARAVALNTWGVLS